MASPGRLGSDRVEAWGLQVRCQAPPWRRLCFVINEVLELLPGFIRGALHAGK